MSKTAYLTEVGFPFGYAIRRNRTSLTLSLWGVLLLPMGLTLVPASAVAASLSCPVENQMTLDFTNGAGWQFCWESKQRENIVLSDIHFRSPEGHSMLVISSLRLAQLHVSYDDSNITYNDVTQFGLGAEFVSTLLDTDCPNGELIEFNGRPGLCKLRSHGDDAYHTVEETRHAESVSLFSNSQVGSYAYLVTWKFFDDGSISPSIGAAGALQRSSDDAHSLYGRELEGAPGKSWLSHTHNYYWRIDFDIGESSTDDIVSEVSYAQGQDGRRERHVLPLVKESARKIDPESMTSWFITSGTDEIDQAPGYVIEPLHYGHKFVQTETEPFTDFDFFVTRHSDCERFVSENAKFNPDCDENIMQFVNDESLVDEDIVVWHRISFHHIPRNEDRHDMHSHWDGFVMQARNLSLTTPGHSGRRRNSSPLVAAVSDQQNTRADIVQLSLQSSDPDDDALIYTASGLPHGIQLNEQGHFHGSPTQDGLYAVSVAVSDSVHDVTVGFDWQIGQSRLERSKTGAAWPLLWLCFFIVCIRKAVTEFRSLSV